jgi:hypothetical protein
LSLFRRYRVLMPFKDPEVAREYRREQSRRRYGEARRAYERERKNAKRVAGYMLLPEPLRSQKLASNAKRRSLNLRWRVGEDLYY